MRALGPISVVIPSYNYGRFVCEAVDSALAQTYRDVEVIVVDDGSTDDTHDRLSHYGKRIRYIHQANKGLSGARNTGIRAATSDWIALLDSDDVWHHQMLGLLAGLAHKHGVDGVAALKVQDLTELDRPLPVDPPMRKVTLEELLTTTSLPPSAILLRRRAIEDVGYFDESLRSVEDRDMWIRLATRYTLGLTDCRALFYRLHPNQMNRNADRMLKNFERVLDKFFTEHPQHASLHDRAYSFMYVDAAIAFMEAGDRKAALQNITRSLRLCPFIAGGDRKFSTAVRLKILMRLLMGERLFQVVGRPRA